MGLLASVLRREARATDGLMPYRHPTSGPSPRRAAAVSPATTSWTRSRGWDDVTAGVVLARLAPTTDLSFFTMAENAVASALCDLLLRQDGEPRIPVVALIDARLAVGETDGWHYDDMPEDGQAWRDTLAAPRRGRPRTPTAAGSPS